MDRPTFSQSWSRVSRLTPTLRPQVQINRQLFHGEPWHIVHEPITNNFFRLNPVAYHFVGLLDGRRSVNEAWRLTLDRFGDEAPTQNEVIGLLGQLNESNLLRVDLPPDAAPLLKRQQRRVLREIGGQFLSILSLKFPIFNPNRLVTWLVPMFRPVLSIPGLILWFILIISTIIYFVPHFDQFMAQTDSILDPQNWVWTMIIFLLIKSWHELGHALVCKRCGGEVPEVGVMLLVFFPAPYVDATSSWNFPSKWKRLLVGGAGMMFELVIACIAVYIWVNSDENSLSRQLSYNAIFLASVTTIFFNINPLLRFDGYYMLSDLLSIPNLYDRAGRHLCYLAQHYLFGIRNAQPASTVPLEAGFLVAFGILSQFYRMFVMYNISMFIAAKFPAVAILIAAWAIIAWMIFPVCKFLHWLFTDPALQENRGRAITVTAVLAIVLLDLIAVVPVSDRRRAQGIVESETSSQLTMDSDAFIRQVRIDSGDHVKKGDIILVADNPSLRADRADVKAQLDQALIMQRAALGKDPLEVKLAKPRIEALRAALGDLDHRLDTLTVRSPQDGIVVGSPLHQLEGQYYKRGQVIAQVMDLDHLRVTAFIDQSSNAGLFSAGIRKAEMRPIASTEHILVGQVERTIDGGRTELPHPALGYAGGGSVPTDPHDPKGLKTLRPQFEIWLSLPADALRRQHIMPGERVHVRLTLAQDTPLLFQGYRWLIQTILDRLDLVDRRG